MFLDVLQNSHQKFHMGFSSKGVKKSFRMPSANEKDKESCISRLHFCVNLGDKDAVITELFIKKEKKRYGGEAVCLAHSKNE